LSAQRHRVLGVACDVADEDQVAALVDRTVTEFGRLDMAFNNAGIMLPLADAADELADSFDRVTAINLRGVWACMNDRRSDPTRSRCLQRMCRSVRGPALGIAVARACKARAPNRSRERVVTSRSSAPRNPGVVEQSRAQTRHSRV
jgi:NAD(P)-dependent dehydrogenase (short-subunit alcohol dehydrogenase family)